jgi:hypothetical protein
MFNLSKFTRVVGPPQQRLNWFACRPNRANERDQVLVSTPRQHKDLDVSVRITQRFESLADTVESDPAGDDRLGVDFTVGKPLQHWSRRLKRPPLVVHTHRHTAKRHKPQTLGLPGRAKPSANRSAPNTLCSNGSCAATSVGAA